MNKGNFTDFTAHPCGERQGRECSRYEVTVIPDICRICQTNRVEVEAILTRTRQMAGLPALERKFPPIGTQIKSFGKSVVKQVMSGNPRRSPEEIVRIKEICYACEHFSDGKIQRCKKCGCALNVKARWGSANCPIGKWKDAGLDIGPEITDAEFEQTHPVSVCKNMFTWNFRWRGRIFTPKEDFLNYGSQAETYRLHDKRQGPKDTYNIEWHAHKVADIGTRGAVAECGFWESAWHLDTKGLWGSSSLMTKEAQQRVLDIESDQSLLDKLKGNTKYAPSVFEGVEEFDEWDGIVLICQRPNDKSVKYGGGSEKYWDFVKESAKKHGANLLIKLHPKNNVADRKAHKEAIKGTKARIGTCTLEVLKQVEYVLTFNSTIAGECLVNHIPVVQHSEGYFKDLPGMGRDATPDMMDKTVTFIAKHYCIKPFTDPAEAEKLFEAFEKSDDMFPLPEEYSYANYIQGTVNPKVTVVMNTDGKHPHLIEEAIYSFLQQDYKNCELLIVCVHPDKLRLDKEYPNVKVVNILPFDKYSQQIAFALGQIKTPYWTVLDSDDYITPDHISKLVSNSLPVITGTHQRVLATRLMYSDKGKVSGLRPYQKGWTNSLFTRPSSDQLLKIAEEAGKTVDTAGFDTFICNKADWTTLSAKNRGRGTYLYRLGEGYHISKPNLRVEGDAVNLPVITPQNHTNVLDRINKYYSKKTLDI